MQGGRGRCLGPVGLVLTACYSPYLPSWVYPSHPVGRVVVLGFDTVLWMRLVRCRVRLGRLAWHGGRVSLGSFLFGALALVWWRPVGALLLPDVVHRQVVAWWVSACWDGLRRFRVRGWETPASEDAPQRPRGHHQARQRPLKAGQHRLPAGEGANQHHGAADTAETTSKGTEPLNRRQW